MKATKNLRPMGVWLATMALTSCGSSQEAPRTHLPVVIEAPTGNGAANDLGWVVSVDSFRAVIAEPRFTIEGETHATWFDRATLWLLAPAYAHPGHSAGGEVAGSLPGTFVVDWIREAGRTLGTAEMILTRYRGIDLDLPNGLATQPEGDPLRAAAAAIEGTAAREDRVVRFSAILAVEPKTQIVGVPLDLLVTAETKSAVGLALALLDPVTGKSFFREVDFAILDPDGDGTAVIEAGSGAHNVLRRHLAEHIHYQGRPVAAPPGP